MTSVHMESDGTLHEYFTYFEPGIYRTVDDGRLKLENDMLL